MPSERRRELLEAASCERLLRAGAALERKGKALLDQHYQPPPGPISGEMRRYLAAFDAWMKDPSDENFKIKRSALQAMLLAR